MYDVFFQIETLLPLTNAWLPPIGLITVFDAILTGRQTRLK